MLHYRKLEKRIKAFIILPFVDNHYLVCISFHIHAHILIYLTKKKLWSYFTILQPNEWPSNGALTSDLVITRQRKWPACQAGCGVTEPRSLPTKNALIQGGGWRPTFHFTIPGGIIHLVTKRMVCSTPPLAPPPLRDPAALELYFW